MVYRRVGWSYFDTIHIPDLSKASVRGSILLFFLYPRSTFHPSLQLEIVLLKKILQIRQLPRHLLLRPLHILLRTGPIVSIISHQHMHLIQHLPARLRQEPLEHLIFQLHVLDHLSTDSTHRLNDILRTIQPLRRREELALILLRIKQYGCNPRPGIRNVNQRQPIPGTANGGQHKCPIARRRRTRLVHGKVVLHEAPRGEERGPDGLRSDVRLDLGLYVKVLRRPQLPVGDFVRVRHAAPDEVVGALPDGLVDERGGLPRLGRARRPVVGGECDGEDGVGAAEGCREGGWRVEVCGYVLGAGGGEGEGCGAGGVARDGADLVERGELRRG